MICPVCKKQVRPGHFACVHARVIGRIITAKKSAASRRNAKLGGRPKRKAKINLD